MRLRHAAIAVLGASPRAEPGGGSMRRMQTLLLARGAIVRTYDAARAGCARFPTARATLHGSDAAVILSAHPPISVLKPHDFLREGVRIIVDAIGRRDKNLFLSQGLTYRDVSSQNAQV